MAKLTIPIVVDLDSIKDRIKNGDLVEVVRCKDCKWHDDDFCLNLDVMGFYANDYCSFGQRKETDDAVH